MFSQSKNTNKYTRMYIDGYGYQFVYVKIRKLFKALKRPMKALKEFNLKES